MKINVTLIRHAKTQGNLNHAYIGKTDEPLCESGIRELEAALEQGGYPPADVVYTSPLKRCTQTAEYLYPKVPQTLKSGLAECDFGDFEGKNYEQLKDEPAYQSFLDSGGESPFPKGESRADFSKRCQETFLEIMDHHSEGQRIVILCHGGTIMAILGEYSSPHSGFYDWQVKNAEGYSFLFDTEQQAATDIKKIKGAQN